MTHENPKNYTIKFYHEIEKKLIQFGKKIPLVFIYVDH